MAKAKPVFDTMYSPPDNRAEYLAERDTDREFDKEWKGRMNRTRRPGFDKLSNMRYKGGK